MAKKRKKAKRKSGRRKSAKRPNPAPRAHKRRKSGRRRAARRNPAPKMHKARRSGRRRARRNPAGLSFMQMGACGLGGAAAVGVEYGISKIPSLTGYAFLAVDALALVALAVGAAYAKMPNVAAGMCGVGGFKTTKNLIAAYNLWQSTKAAPKKDPAPGTKGLGSVRYLGPRSTVAAPGMGSVRYAR